MLRMPRRFCFMSGSRLYVLVLYVSEETHRGGMNIPSVRSNRGSVNNGRAICSAQVISGSLTNGIQQMSSRLRFI